MTSFWKRLILPCAFLLTICGLAVGNDYYTHGGFPATGSVASSAGMRAELDAITSGFDKLPTFTGNANKAVLINGSATGLTVTAGTFSLSGNFATTGGFNTTLAQGANTTLTLPLVNGTLATLAGTESFSNHTYVAPNFSGTATGSLTNLALTTPALTGTVTGTYTLGGSPTVASPTFSGTASGSLTNLALTTPVLTGTVTGTYTLGGTPTVASPTFTGAASGSLTGLAVTNGVLTTSTVTADPTSSLGIASKQYVDQQNLLSVMENGRLSITMSANAVTIALKGNDGNDPSSTNPVRMTFRSSTATSSAFVTRTITSALSTTISSGSTGGTVNNTPARVYISAIDNAGTVELAWFTTILGTSLWSPPETVLISTTAEGGAGAADSAQVVYSTTARSNAPHRLIGYFEATETTAGTWATSASFVQLMGPGVKRTGDVVQVNRNVISAVATGTTVIPFDDTVPQNSEGDQYATQTITPTSAINLLKVDFSGFFSHSASTNATSALFQDSSANALAALSVTTPNSGYTYQMILQHVMLSGTTSATTFKIRAGGTAGTMTFNGVAGGRLYGGAASSSMKVEEIFS